MIKIIDHHFKAHYINPAHVSRVCRSESGKHTEIHIYHHTILVDEQIDDVITLIKGRDKNAG